jgi:hypothetical protein
MHVVQGATSHMKGGKRQGLPHMEHGSKGGKGPGSTMRLHYWHARVVGDGWERVRGCEQWCVQGEPMGMLKILPNVIWVVSSVYDCFYKDMFVCLGKKKTFVVVTHDFRQIYILALSRKEFNSKLKYFKFD